MHNSANQPSRDGKCKKIDKPASWWRHAMAPRHGAAVVAGIAASLYAHSASAQEIYLHCMLQNWCCNPMDYRVDPQRQTAIAVFNGETLPARITPHEIIINGVIHINRMTGELTNTAIARFPGTCTKIDRPAIPWLSRREILRLRSRNGVHCGDGDEQCHDQTTRPDCNGGGKRGSCGHELCLSAIFPGGSARRQTAGVHS
jgi:hypothetical protein